MIPACAFKLSCVGTVSGCNGDCCGCAFRVSIDSASSSFRFEISLTFPPSSSFTTFVTDSVEVDEGLIILWGVVTGIGVDDVDGFISSDGKVKAC